MTIQHGFELIQDQHIPELNTQARLWRHVRTGAELLSLVNDDENKTFAITFRTPPPDSTGVAHIMEHSVLCGSDKYQLKEPFVELIKGSLNTFLNAFTFPDKTAYPVASTNLKDFYNLIDVYLDAVFHPLISPYTFYQEGWHYEVDEENGDLNFKGVVFNEMKGNYSSADSMLAEACQHSVFPDTLYSLDSGGDPEVIPDLTYAQFKDFHERYYHPSNARIWFYGNDDEAERLRLMEAALAGYERIEIDSHVPLQSPFTAPRWSEAVYDSGDDEQAKAQVQVNWVMPEVSESETSLGLEILSHVLMGTSAAPLRKALIDSGLGEDLTGSGYDSDYRQPLFTAGLKGIAVENAQTVEALILDTLRGLAEEGIDADTISASMNTVEFMLRENNTGNFPRGLSLMLAALHTWLYDKDPIAPLAFEAPLQSIKQRIANGERYFEGLISKYLTENPHRATVLLRPDPQYGKQREEKELQRLQAARAVMSADDLETVRATMQELQRRQETPDSPEALASLPTLLRSDLETKVRSVPNEVLSSGAGQILFHNLFTNGILYLEAGLNLRGLDPAWLPYVPIFSRALTETGAGNLDFVQLVQRIGQQTGGIYPTVFNSNQRGRKEGVSWMFLRGKAMLDQSAHLLNLMREVLFNAHLDDRDRIRQIVLEDKASWEAGVVQAGHRVVNSRIRAHFTEADWAAEQMTGVSQLFFLRDLLKQIDENWAGVQAVFESIRTRMLTQAGLLLNVTVDESAFKALRPALDDFIAHFPTEPYRMAHWERGSYAENEAFTLPTQVNYVGKGLNLYEHGYRFNGSIFVIQPYLRNTYLWEKVRVMGGAYGAMNSFDQHSGMYTYISYRDPNLDETLKAYDQAAAFLRGLELSEAELTKALIGAIGEVDPYQLPDAKGYSAMLRFILGISDEQRQKNRDELLATTLADFHAFADALDQVRLHGDVSAVAGADAVKKSTLAEQFKIHKVL
jgi:Zn-dependent M16 (insulinase) family peptidase